MARIRTIKPGFFRHEGLQDLETANPGKYPMLVFAALWGHCDREGRFEWRPRQMKLDILPFLNFVLEETLDILEAAGHIRRYEVAGKMYGFIPSFTEHQKISGKEAQTESKLPEPPREVTETKQGSDGEATVKLSGGQEGKGREQEGKEERSSAGEEKKVSRETFIAKALRLTEIDPNKHHFTEVAFGQWFSEGVTEDDLDCIVQVLARERERDGNPSLVKPPGYFTEAVRRAKRDRENLKAASNEMEDALARWKRGEDAA